MNNKSCRWRRGSGGHHYYEEGKYGVAYVRTCDEGYFARVLNASKTFKLLRDAKQWVESALRRSCVGGRERK